MQLQCVCAVCFIQMSASNNPARPRLCDRLSRPSKEREALRREREREREREIERDGEVEKRKEGMGDKTGKKKRRKECVGLFCPRKYQCN